MELEGYLKQTLSQKIISKPCKRKPRSRVFEGKVKSSFVCGVSKNITWVLSDDWHEIGRHLIS